MHLPELLRLPLARLARRPLAACAAIVMPLVLAGGALAATTAFSSPSAAPPQLTTNTSVCGGSVPKGVMRCFAVVRTPSNHKITADTSGPQPGSLGPADIQSAYKLPSATAGSGQTVAIVDAGDDPTAEADLATFRSQYGLPPCTTANGCLKIVNQDGQASPLPPVQCSANAGGCWPVEESLDLDAVSSACPNCNILLVEANDADNTGPNLETAVNEAVSLGAKFVSNSYGGNEDPSQLQDDQNYNHPGVVVTASTGDGGYGVNYPSASQYVTAVGGTTLTKDSSVSRGWDESVWSGTGSGCSAVEPQPSFQLGISQLTAVCSNRAVADVSADADPASGLGIYDSNGYGGVNGWLQVGGTSLSSPLIAATYALAGAPASGTYPNAYPYHDTSQSADLFDITQGSNGNCGNVLCTAGPGWDGPTGLGTPDGVKAFVGAPQGQISGQVTDKAAGKPVTGVTVTAQPGDFVTRTDASGNYNLALTVGTYTLTVTDYGYQTGTRSGVQVTAGQTSTENFALTAEPSGTLSGTVTDGSGHGWPLHAQITIPGYPGGSIWTSPYTGKYSVTVPRGSYTLTLSTDYSGYQQKQVQVTVNGNATQNMTLEADLTACTAPGYGWNGLSEDFTGWTGAAAEDGWTVTSQGPDGWRFDDPGNRPPPVLLQQGVVQGGDDNFAIADSGYSAPRPLNTSLTSPAVSLAGQSTPQLQFDAAYYPVSAGSSVASAQVSTDGGRSWAIVWHQTAANAIEPVSIPVPQAAGKPDVRVRFTYTGHDAGYWAVDDVFLGTHTCVERKGGLLAGTVTDKSTGNPVNGATVTSARATGPQPWPEGISLATGDPALPGGFYWLFAPAGSQTASAAAFGYSTASATVNITADQVTRQDWVLASAAGS